MESRSLLVSDVDNTVLGDDATTRAFAEWIESNRYRVRLAYNSGRFTDSVWRSVEETDLPVPDAIIGGVGTQIFFVDGRASLDGWPAVQETWSAAAVREELRGYPQLELQPGHLQSEHKVSFFGYDLASEFLERLENRLGVLGLNARVIYSSRRDLDVLPSSAGKGRAVVRLADHWGFAKNEVIVCGDSGNDVGMFEHGYRGIVVGNAHPELKALCGENIYQSQASHAAGVLEGLHHWLSEI